MKLKIVLGLILTCILSYSTTVRAINEGESVHYGDFIDDVYFIDQDGQNSLIYAITKSKPIRDILTRKPNVNLQDKWGKTALMYAADRYQLKDIIKLLNAGAYLDITDNEGRTALMHAFQKGVDNVTIALIGGRANLNLQDNEGRTALMLGIISLPGKKISPAVKKLIRTGANLDLKDNEGNTALMLATERRQSEVVDELLGAGANANRRNKDNERAWDIANKLRLHDIATSLSPYTSVSFAGGLRSFKEMFAKK
ncbi:ankyrin repeat domain-containing protein [bacterium]|jgi:uncharacterized protein|nr:ankyrin repeat domain-containing protein [bacterium]MBT5015839.1 ankyrin repeat domain-containing protein [bacterium]